MDSLLIEVSPSKWLLRCWINSLPSSVASSLGTMDTQVGPLSCVGCGGQLSCGMELWGRDTGSKWQSLGLNQTTLKPELRLGLINWKALEKKVSLSALPWLLMHFPASWRLLTQSVLALYWKGVASVWEKLTGCSSPLQSSQLALKRTYSASACAEVPRILEARPLTNKCLDVLSWLKPGRVKKPGFWGVVSYSTSAPKNPEKKSICFNMRKDQTHIPFSKLPSLRHNQSITRVSNTAELDYGKLATSHPWTPWNYKSCKREKHKRWQPCRQVAKQPSLPGTGRWSEPRQGGDWSQQQCCCECWVLGLGGLVAALMHH